jgi:hypothetical protein
MEKNSQSASAKAVRGTSGKHLSLHVKPKLIPIFFQLLGHGFSVNIQTGVSVKDLLCKQLGIHEDYLAQRIQSVFLNASVVDDVTSAMVHDGSTLALSGAMPGLVGAILRSGGFYAAMRSQISYGDSKQSSPRTTGRITLKLLNLIVKELGPTFLQQGIWIKGQELLEFMTRNSTSLEGGCLSSELEGKPLTPGSLRKLDWNTEMVFLKVVSSQQSA